MCAATNPTLKKRSWEPPRDMMSGVSSAIRYTMPVVRKSKGCSYIEFYAFDPEKGEMRRKRIKTNRIKGSKENRKYINDVLTRLTNQLTHGWNPWIAKDTENLDVFTDVLDRYERHLEKMLASGYYRSETYNGYKSQTKILREYARAVKPIYYVYQFDRTYCVNFLDHVFIERENCAQTRNNYLAYLKVLSGYMVERGYLKSRPTDGISMISKRLYKKSRTDIPLDKVKAIGEWCRENDRHFMLALYILYYSFIRPVEIMRMRLSWLQPKYGTIIVPADCSKNGKEQVVTMPKKVWHYCIDLGIFSAAASDYLFSNNLRPGPTAMSPKLLRDHWGKMRNVLNLRPEWKLYSMKDTGITAMLKDKVATVDVRDQARHSSLAITELYVHHAEAVNTEILNMDGAL